MDFGFGVEWNFALGLVEFVVVEMLDGDELMVWS
jgi:hypothetical protein